MDCSVCISPFGEHRRPLTLPCGHSFCRPCVTQVHREKGYVVCPKCQVHHLGRAVADFPINYELEDLMESLKDSPTEDSCSVLSSVSGRLRGKDDDICPECRTVIDLWCDNCRDLVCDDCTLSLHRSRNHNIILAKDAVIKLQQGYLDRLEKVDSLLIKNAVVSKELSLSASSLVTKLNKTVAELEEQRTRMRSQKMHIKSGLSLGELSRIIESSQFDCDFSCPTVLQEIKAAQVMSCSMEMVIKSFQALETEVPPRIQVTQSAATANSPSAEVKQSATTACSPTESGATSTSTEGFPQYSTIATFPLRMPRMLRESPHGSFVNVPEGVAIPYFVNFRLTATSEDSEFSVAFAPNCGQYAMFHLDVVFSDSTAVLQTSDPDDDGVVEFPSNHFPFECNEQFVLTIEEYATKFVVQYNGRFLAFCRKSGQPNSTTRCVRIFIEGKGVVLQDFEVIKD